MKKKNGYERFKPDFAAGKEENGREALEEMMKKINDMSENVPVPDSLSPENMMKKINEAKKSDKRIVKREKAIKHHNPFKNRFYNRVIAGGISVAVIVAVLFTCFYSGNHSFEVKSNTGNMQLNKEEPASETGTNNVLSASSRDEIVGIITKATMEEYNNRTENSDLNTKNDAICDIEEIGVLPNATEGSDEGNQEVSSDYYKNNDQVEGVVEADSVITDGKYIYSITEWENVNIMSAENGTVHNISKIAFYKDYDLEKDGFSIFLNSSKLFVVRDKLIIVFDYEIARNRNGKWENYLSSDLYSRYDFEDAKEYTVIMQYDLSDINHPELDNYHVVEGSINSSRVVEDYVYVITSKSINMYIAENESTTGGLKRIENECIPRIDNKEISYEKIYIAQEENTEYNYQIVTSFQVDKNELKHADHCAVLSENGKVYVSNQHIYTASWQLKQNEDIISDDQKIVNQYTDTKIYKFAYQNGSITPCAMGVVPGCILNQFSLDEYKGYLRLVSTISKWEYSIQSHGVIEEMSSYKSSQENALFVLDENLNVCGKIEEIAKNENIYSARFIGDYAYFVTFRQTDPLFVADLSNPENPVILDELKVTGFSDYLHVWTENVLLGVGSEADESGLTTGAKISLFDISDKTNISEISKFVIDGAYSSDVYNYKNMFVAPEKSLFGMSITDFWRQSIYDGFSNDEIRASFWLFKYENGKFTNVLQYRYGGTEKTQDSVIIEQIYQDNEYRGLYIGDYLYIIVVDQGIVPVSLNDYSLGEFVDFD